MKVYGLINIFLISALYILIGGCNSSPFAIEEYYQVSQYDSVTYIFECKLGGANSPRISFINYIEWNDKLIKIQAQGQDYYIIKAKGKTLCCGCGDILIGPLNKQEYENELNKLGALEELSNVKKFFSN